MSVQQHSRLVDLYDYWTAKRGSRRAPTRADIDPLDIPELLPYLTLIDVLRDPLRFRYRLVGTAVVEALERDATGRFADKRLLGTGAGEIIRTFERHVRECRPFHRRSSLSWHDQEWLIVDAIDLPLVDASGRVAIILRGNSFTIASNEAPPASLYEPLAESR